MTLETLSEEGGSATKGAGAAFLATEMLDVEFDSISRSDVNLDPDKRNSPNARSEADGLGLKPPASSDEGNALLRDGSQELVSSLLKLLQNATKEVDSNRDAAKATIARASSLLRAEVGRIAYSEKSYTSGGLAVWQVQKVKTFIEQNLDKPLRIEQMSKIVRLSATYFTHAFRISFGEAPHAYLMQRRISHACHLMLVSDLDLSNIALACGFADQAHFSRRFRQATSVSPAAWRRERREKP